MARRDRSRTLPFTRNRRTPPNTDPYAHLHVKLRRIKELRQKINNVKHYYEEHDALMEEVLPYFIQTLPDRFIVLRHVTLGFETYRLAPFFFDEKKSQLVPKTWKSTAHPTFTIEG